MVTPVQWEVMHCFGWASEAGIDETDVCALDSNHTGTISPTSVLNGHGLAGDRVNVHFPVERIAGINLCSRRGRLSMDG